ncbi:glycosyltransferase [Dyella sp. A6]|uniref:glycosyltransferase n=1 Tax=Dyella aluminiiresistens TaxID=3069105 RepID=UPI002E7A918F|nr:glycosyltransferase [Dyella sp. A6]
MTNQPLHVARLRLLGRDNGAGLTRELHLTADMLRAVGLDTTVSGLPHRGRAAEWLTRLKMRIAPTDYDINVFFERIRPEFIPGARRNVLIPFPEWFRDEDRPHLQRIDEIWTKTHHASPLFEALGARVRFIGGTSFDRMLPNEPRKHAFFHGPGRSGNKGTEALLKLWSENPHWPKLTLIWRRKRMNVNEVPANVNWIRDFIDDDEYRRLQNAHRFHLCPSQTEGYGHYLVEAMSCGAVVVTLDAEPMNEMVTTERGMLVPAIPAGTQRLSTLYGFTEVAMHEAIRRCIAMTESQAEVLGQAARAWFVANSKAYPQRLKAIAEHLATKIRD